MDSDALPADTVHRPDASDTTVIKTADGRDLAFCEWGVPTGRPVFSLHGCPGSRYFVGAQGLYERQNLRVVTYDRPGYGLSTPLPGRLVPTVAPDVIVIADVLGWDTFGIVGTSSGGPYALAVGALFPDRVSRCAAVVTGAPRDADGLDYFADMDPQARADIEAIEAGGERAASQQFTQFLDWFENDFLRGTAMPSEDEQSRSVLERAIREAIRQGDRGFVDDLLADVDGWGFDVADVLAPTRVMLARDDHSVPPAHGEWLVNRLPHGELLWVDGGHLGPRDEPEEQLLGWVGG